MRYYIIAIGLTLMYVYIMSGMFVSQELILTVLTK